MALETPNAVCAAAVFTYEAALALGERIVVESSNGILAKHEFEIAEPDPDPPTPGGVYFDLEQPVSAQEGCVINNGLILTAATCTAWITPQPTPLLVPEFDDLPDNVLAGFIVNESPFPRLRFSLAVLRLLAANA
jgi:hypothetical protein